MVLPNPHIIFLDTDCFLHQYQLMVKADLDHADVLFRTEFKANYNFYSSLSKLMIVWRNNAREMFSEWAKRFPGPSSSFAARVPPKCIRGRWGAVSLCAKFVLAPPREDLVCVFNALCDSNYKKKAPGGSGRVPTTNQMTTILTRKT